MPESQSALPAGESGTPTASRHNPIVLLAIFDSSARVPCFLNRRVRVFPITGWMSQCSCSAANGVAHPTCPDVKTAISTASIARATTMPPTATTLVVVLIFASSA